MFKRKKKPSEYEETYEIPYQSYNDEDEERKKANQKKKQGCLIGFASFIVLAMCIGVALLNRNRTANVQMTPDSDDGQPAVVDSGLVMVRYSSSGKQIGVYNLEGEEINTSEEAQAFLPVSALDNLPSSLNAIAYPEGAFYDTVSQQLVVFGSPAVADAPSSSDDFLVALRSIYGQQEPAVSIDPVNGSSTVQNVRYLGQTEATHFGWVMFEADRIMKTLSMGQDNISGKEVTVNVPGFANMFDLEFRSGMSSEDNTRRRFWFTVPNVEIEENADGLGMVISALSINVKTEYLDSNWETLENQPPDPAGQAFAAHISEHYDEYARELPVFNDLKALAHWTALAHWLKQSNLPIQPELWLINSPAQYDAPLTTPAITTTRQETQVNTIRTMSLWGGVDLGMKIKIQAAQATTKQKLKEVTDQFKSRFMPVEANVSVGFAPVSPQGYKQSASAQVKLPFDLVSQMSYSDNHWELHLPRLKRYGEKENSYFLLDDGKSSTPMLLTSSGYDEENKTRIFTNRAEGEWLAEFSDAYQVVNGSFQEDGTFVYTPEDFKLFDLQGQIIQDAISGVDYIYESGHLAGIRQGNQEIKVNWNSDDTIRDIQSGDKKVSFDYKNGLLTDVTGAASHKFEYDVHGRLTRELDTEGKIISLTRYDSQNRISFHLENGEAELYDWTLDGEPKTYKGSALLPWQGASEKDLDDFKTALILNQDKRIDNIFFVRRIDNKVVVFSNGSSYTVPDYLLKNPQRLRDKLKAISGELNKPGKVLISTGDVREVSFQTLFPQAISITVDTMDKKRVLKNLQKLDELTPFTPQTASIINAIPLPEEVEKVGFQKEDAPLWVGLKDSIGEMITRAGYSSSIISAVQIQSALHNNPYVLVVVAHGDQKQIYFPDGSVFAPETLSPEQKASIAKQNPFVVLLSCNTGEILPGEVSFSQRLLELGPSMVVAPNGTISAKDASDILENFLENTKTTDSLHAIFKSIQSVYPDWLIPSSDGLEHFFEFRSWNISPQKMESNHEYL